MKPAPLGLLKANNTAYSTVHTKTFTTRSRKIHSFHDDNHHFSAAQFWKYPERKDNNAVRGVLLELYVHQQHQLRRCKSEQVREAARPSSASFTPSALALKGSPCGETGWLRPHQPTHGRFFFHTLRGRFYTLGRPHR